MIEIPTILLIGIVAYLAIGAAFAACMAISPAAIAVLLVAWPLFAVLIVLAPLINWYVNREFNETHTKE